MRNRIGFICCLLFSVLLPAWSQIVPHCITYQGKLCDTTGKAVTDGSYQVSFGIYAAAVGGLAQWTSGPMTVQTKGGVFSCLLEPLSPDDLDSAVPLWLEVSVGSPATPLSPRVLLTSAPFALRAGSLSLPQYLSSSTEEPLFYLRNTGTGPALKAHGNTIAASFIGAVGIGTDTPVCPLDVASEQSVLRLHSLADLNGSVLVMKNDLANATNIGAINFENAQGDTPGQLAYLTTDAMTFRTGGYERMRLDGAGRLGVGTTAPSELLDLVNPQVNLRLYSSNSTWGSSINFYNNNANSSGLGALRFFNSGGTQMGLLAYLTSNAMTFGTSSIERMRIDASGRVGLGTVSPSAPLDVVNSQSVVRLNSTNNPSGSVVVLKNATGTSTGLGAINFENNAGATPGQLAYTTGNEMTFRTNGTERMRLNSLGMLGIGTANPGAPLEIAGSQAFARLNTVSSTSGSVLILKSSVAAPNTEGAINFENAANETRGQIAYQHNNDMVFRVNNAESFRLFSDGSAGLGYAGPPSAKLTVADNSGKMLLNLIQNAADSNNEPLVVQNYGDSTAFYLAQINALTTKPGMYLSYGGNGNSLKMSHGGPDYGIYLNATAGNGLRVVVPQGKVGLSVEGGSKNAIVDTSQGKKLLYSEESSEVWFTDYGTGTLKNGRAVLTIDPVFADTVDLTQKYHVFVQPNDPECAGLAVTNRTASGFEVVELRHGTSNGEFSYRLVAKRKGFAQERLAPAP